MKILIQRYKRLLFLIAFCSSAFYVSSLEEALLPEHFPEPVYAFAKNPISRKKVQVGRALFYDPILSKDNSISCASCHSPYNAFAHTDHDLSHGINDQIGTRNAPALFNLAWQQFFMWDGAINHLDMQALAPISHPKEMNETLERVVGKLQASPIYPKLFYEAFKDSVITGEQLLKSLSQFQLTLVSASAKYDKVKTGEAQFSEQETKGYALFKEHCNSCHMEPLFYNNRFANNGLAIDSTLNDFGKGVLSGISTDSLRFKIPTLRNLSFTYPYMHDGRFRKLSQVLRHYTEGINNNSNTKHDIDKAIVLTSNEKTDLIAFLLTLDDKEFVFDQKHQFPRELLLK
ncbi:MAG: cytochrome c peroxidase [Polaribacter sp.]|jgi:cytochrome c peroxidase